MLLLMGFVWRRGVGDSVWRLFSNKQGYEFNNWIVDDLTGFASTGAT